MNHKRDLIGIFAHHRVAANLLMSIMLISGIYALDRLNIQFFPNFALDMVSVRVVWRGASAEDVETSITIPLEQRLRTVDNLRKMTSTSAQGVSSITIEFEEGTDPVIALDQVKQQVDEYRNFPSDAEEPEVIHLTRYEPVARLLITGASGHDELRHLAREFERELLSRGIDKIEILGLPEEEVAIQVSTTNLEHLQLSLDEIGTRIDELSLDFPAGTLGERDGARDLRSLAQGRDEWDFARMPIVSDEERRIDLGAVAAIARQPMKGEASVSVMGRPAIELQLKRAENGNSLRAAEILATWLTETRPTLPPDIKLHVYDQSWQLIKERITLLLKNGAGGLVLVVTILYLFLTGRVAFWVAVGIPVSFMATLAILYFAGGSINMISLFALIMALGIIVDDAIVVGEDALAHYQAGEDALLSAEGGARRMFAPVIASSLTTVAAFLPLMMVTGIIGNVLFAIPLVIVSVIIASVIESFLVLPGHLRHSFTHIGHVTPGPLRRRLDHGFERFRERVFRPIVGLALEYRAVTLSSGLALLALSAGLLAGGRLNFTFFPSPESQILYANASFVSGTPKAKVQEFLNHLETTLIETESALLGSASPKTKAEYLRRFETDDRASEIGHETDLSTTSEPLVVTAVTRQGVISSDGRNLQSGDQLGSMVLELSAPDQRTIRNGEFTRAWRERITLPPGMETFTITSRRAGPPGRDLTVRLTARNAEQLKEAVLRLAESLTSIAGISEVEDDMPYGREQLIYELTPAGEALGLTTAQLGRQLRTGFDGRLVQLFQDGPDEVEVRVQLPAEERERLSALGRINIRLSSGEFVPLSTVARWHARRGFEALRHADGQLAAEVSAEVDTAVTNTNRVLKQLAQTVLPELANRYGIGYSFEGRAADQAETLRDMRRGVVLGLSLIYLVLAWVFSSYGWPLVVMSAIPFGLIGAITGHWLMGIDLTILSLFGLFGLSGIVVNDSIILVSFYKRLRDSGLAVKEALVEAAIQRLRAVLLTSLTTIGGLTPLLFETSLQAQFLIPMATSIAFGLAFATVIVLLVIPALLSYHETLSERIRTRGTLTAVQNAP